MMQDAVPLSSDAGRPTQPTVVVPVAGSISSTTRTSLRAVAQAAREGRLAEPVVRDAATRVAGDAHERAVTAEHMIIAVKREWAGLPEVGRLGGGADARSVIDRVITHCIDAFYAPR